MRRCILLIMIALLPMRGWIGDAMATEMASSRSQVNSEQSQSATEIIAGHAHLAGAADYFGYKNVQENSVTPGTDCFDHSGAGEASDGAHCNTCTVCQVCHTVALSPGFAGSDAALSLVTPPHSPVALFASADPAHGKKPPIS